MGKFHAAIDAAEMPEAEREAMHKKVPSVDDVIDYVNSAHWSDCPSRDFLNPWESYAGVRPGRESDRWQTVTCGTCQSPDTVESLMDLDALQTFRLR